MFTNHTPYTALPGLLSNKKILIRLKHKFCPIYTLAISVAHVIDSCLMRFRERHTCNYSLHFRPSIPQRIHCQPIFPYGSIRTPKKFEVRHFMRPLISLMVSLDNLVLLTFQTMTLTEIRLNYGILI